MSNGGASDAAAGKGGYLHETAFYGSGGELIDIVAPFLMAGVEAGEPTMVVVRQRTTELIQAALGGTTNVEFLDAAAHYTRPASAIKAFRKVVEDHVAQGARQIRIVGEVPHPGTGAQWERWARYEAAVNDIFDGFPLWGLCLYDTRITPAHILADAVRTHPYLATADGRHLANPHFEQPADFLTQRPVPSTDPLEATPPIVELIDPVPAAARRAVVNVARFSRLGHDEVDDLVLAVSEAVTNGICHGRPPVRLRLWASLDRVVATVTDRGQGPTDPLAGLMPTTDTISGGVGLWLMHQICSHVTFVTDDEGFTIRLIVGVPELAAREWETVL